MHLLGPEFSTVSTKKRKKKLTVSQHHKWCVDWLAYNKQMTKLGANTKTLEEYIQYRKGKSRLNSSRTVKQTTYSSDHREKYPSYGDQIGHVSGKKTKTYTGSLVKGIAVTHKSNLVPVTSQEQAEDIARMRR